MDSKNRLLIAVAVTVLIVGAMLTSFGRSLFILRTPAVELPSGSSRRFMSGMPDAVMRACPFAALLY